MPTKKNKNFSVNIVTFLFYMTVKTISHTEVFNLHFFLDLLCCTLQNKVQHFTSQVLNLKQIKNPSETCMLLFNTSNDSRNQEQRKYTFESSLRLVSIYRSVNTWQRSSYNTDSSVKRLLFCCFFFCLFVWLEGPPRTEMFNWTRWVANPNTEDYVDVEFSILLLFDQDCYINCVNHPFI